MVCVNTYRNSFKDINFTHFVENPNDEYYIGTAREGKSRKTRIYLIFKDHGPIYERQGIKGTWQLIQNDTHIRSIVTEALKQSYIPHFSLSSSLN